MVFSKVCTQEVTAGGVAAGRVVQEVDANILGRLHAPRMPTCLWDRGLGARGQSLAGELHRQLHMGGPAMCMPVVPAQGTELSEQLARDDADGGIAPELKNHYTAITRTASGAYGQVAYFTAFPQELGTIVVLLDDWIAGQMSCPLSGGLLASCASPSTSGMATCSALPPLARLPTAVLKRIPQRRSLLRQPHPCHNVCITKLRYRDDPGRFLMVPLKMTTKRRTSQNDQALKRGCGGACSAAERGWSGSGGGSHFRAAAAAVQVRRRWCGEPPHTYATPSARTGCRPEGEACVCTTSLLRPGVCASPTTSGTCALRHYVTRVPETPEDRRAGAPGGTTGHICLLQERRGGWWGWSRGPAPALSQRGRVAGEAAGRGGCGSGGAWRRRRWAGWRGCGGSWTSCGCATSTTSTSCTTSSGHPLRSTAAACKGAATHRPKWPRCRLCLAFHALRQPRGC